MDNKASPEAEQGPSQLSMDEQIRTGSSGIVLSSLDMLELADEPVLIQMPLHASSRFRRL